MSSAPNPSAPTGMACAVCGLVLNRRVVASADGLAEEWRHTQPADHPTVPVSVRDVRTNFRCDFCLADHALWTLPVEAYEVSPGNNNDGDWAVCDRCAALVRAGDWNRIIDLVHGQFVAEVGPAARPVFKAMYRQLRSHVTGPVRLTIPLERGDSAR